MQHGGKGDPFCLLPCDLLVDFCAATSFSTVRKKHTGPRQSKTVAGFASSTQALTTLVAQMRDLTRARGGAKRPSSDSLTFTHHFRLRRSPHWGPVMRKRPLWTPPASSWFERVELSPCARASQGRLEAVLVVVGWCAARLYGLASLLEQAGFCGGWRWGECYGGAAGFLWQNRTCNRWPKVIYYNVVANWLPQ